MTHTWRTHTLTEVNLHIYQCSFKNVLPIPPVTLSFPPRCSRCSSACRWTKNGSTALRKAHFRDFHNNLQQHSIAGGSSCLVATASQTDPHPPRFLLSDFNVECSDDKWRSYLPFGVSMVRQTQRRHSTANHSIMHFTAQHAPYLPFGVVHTATHTLYAPLHSSDLSPCVCVVLCCAMLCVPSAKVVLFPVGVPASLGALLYTKRAVCYTLLYALLCHAFT